MRGTLSLVFAALLGGCALSSDGDGESLAQPLSPPRTVQIVGQSGQAIGQATFTQARDGVIVRLEFAEGALTPGWHGVHLHQIGVCGDFAAGFTASGPHIGAGNEHVRHGLMHQTGPEAGDLPNIFAPASGPFGAEFIAPNVTMGASSLSERHALLDADGSALVVHAQPDDHLTQPIGGAGARVACAALAP
jgi:Cu-Zn family superoxide dismutase